MDNSIKNAGRKVWGYGPRNEQSTGKEHKRNGSYYAIPSLGFRRIASIVENQVDNTMDDETEATMPFRLQGLGMVAARRLAGPCKSDTVPIGGN